jgi:hypothetical protein
MLPSIDRLEALCNISFVFAEAAVLHALEEVPLLQYISRKESFAFAIVFFLVGRSIASGGENTLGDLLGANNLFDRSLSLLTDSTEVVGISQENLQLAFLLLFDPGECSCATLNCSVQYLVFV